MSFPACYLASLATGVPSPGPDRCDWRRLRVSTPSPATGAVWEEARWPWGGGGWGCHVHPSSSPAQQPWPWPSGKSGGARPLISPQYSPCPGCQPLTGCSAVPEEQGQMQDTAPRELALLPLQGLSSGCACFKSQGSAPACLQPHSFLDLEASWLPREGRGPWDALLSVGTHAKQNQACVCVSVTQPNGCQAPALTDGTCHPGQFQQTRHLNSESLECPFEFLWPGGAGRGLEGLRALGGTWSFLGLLASPEGTMSHLSPLF